MTEAISRLTSLALRSGIDPLHIIEQLKGIRCPERTLDQDKILSCSDAIGKAIEKHLAVSGQVIGSTTKVDHGFRPECPECGSPIEFIEGCLTCKSCGYSKC